MCRLLHVWGVFELQCARAQPWRACCRCRPPTPARWRAARPAQGAAPRVACARAAAVAGLALPPPLRRAWAAQGGRVVACSQAGSLDVQLRDVALGRARTVRWDPPPGAYSGTPAGPDQPVPYFFL